jgi:proteasome lid subunit RPN8/RPN11
MVEITINGGFGRWQAEGCPLAVEYSLDSMDGLRAEAVEGLFRLAKGGLEVGGVLFGERNDGLVRILATRPMACQHASGPAFVLSEKDEADLKAMIESAASDPELSGLVPVGWYHSHTRSGIALSDKDLEIVRRHFPEPWQVSLILHPAKTAPTRAGFFFRAFRSREFTLEPRPRKKKAPPAAAPVEAAPVEEQPAVVPAPRRSNRLPWVLFALACCLAAAATAIAARSLWLPQPLPAAPPPAPAQMVEGVQRAEQLQREVDRLRSELEEALERNKELESKKRRRAAR